MALGDEIDDIFRREVKSLPAYEKAQAASGSGIAPPVDEMNQLLMGLAVATQRSFHLLADRIEGKEKSVSRCLRRSVGSTHERVSRVVPEMREALEKMRRSSRSTCTRRGTTRSHGCGRWSGEVFSSDRQGASTSPCGPARFDLT